MRVLIFTPTALPTITGNAITAERWRRSLRQKGVNARVLATQRMDVPSLLHKLERFAPALVHVHHAFRAGSLLMDSRMMFLLRDLPLVVSPGGTDINLDLEMGDRKEKVKEVYRMARVIVAQSKETLERIKDLLPYLADRIVIVPKAFYWLGHDAFDLRKASGFNSGEMIFFLPGGIRPVKGNLECLTAFEKVYAIRAQARIVFAGPALDTEYAAEFEKKIKSHHSFARWIPSISPAAMRSAYEASDVVLNASSSEGLSNALLEAVAVGKPVLASDIPGNWWPVLGEETDPPTGCLFKKDDPEDFTRYALRLIDDAKLRETFSQAARERASCWPTPEMEAEGLIHAYRAALRASG